MTDPFWVPFETQTGYCEYRKYVDYAPDPSNRKIRCGNPNCTERHQLPLDNLVRQVVSPAGGPNCLGCYQPIALPKDPAVWQFLIKNTGLSIYGSSAPQG